MRHLIRRNLHEDERNASISTYCDPLQPIESSDDRQRSYDRCRDPPRVGQATRRAHARCSQPTTTKNRSDQRETHLEFSPATRYYTRTALERSPRLASRMMEQLKMCKKLLGWHRKRRPLRSTTRP